MQRGKNDEQLSPGIYDQTSVPHVNVTELSENLIRTRGNNSNLFNIIVTMI